MDVYSIRKQNLSKAVELAGGTIAGLARAAGISSAYLTQVLSNRTKRNLGAAVARRIESALEMPEGWMDQVDSPPVRISDEGARIARMWDELPEEQKARFAQELATLHRYVSRR